jgi:hypothetical protein
MGTKTAVQIRSHAQKFFSKLTKGTAAESEWHNLAGLVGQHRQQLLDQVVRHMHPSSGCALNSWCRQSRVAAIESSGSVSPQIIARKSSS